MDGFVNYDALAGSIKAEDVASDEINAGILRRIMNSYPQTTSLYLASHENRDGDDYCPTNAREMGWLGYYVGKSTRIKSVYLAPMDDFSLMGPFCKGVSRNKSIGTLGMNGIEGGDLFRMLGPFFRDNHNLTNFSAEECNLGDEGCRQLSLALGGCTKSSLTDVYLYGCGINGEQFADIAVALSMHPKLEHLTLRENNIGRNGFKALTTLLQFSTADVKSLCLNDCDIDDDAIESMVQILPKCKKLRSLHLSRNASISAKGWGELSSHLESQSCALQELRMGQYPFADEDVVTLVSGLSHNQSLQKLDIGCTPNNFTGQCWEAISTLLCDTSSVNKTYLSNHTLRSIHPTSILPSEVKTLLAINNKEASMKEVAMMKILALHEDLNMQPFFEWDLKVLPLAVDWFERAQSISVPSVQKDATQRDIHLMKSSAIYQFVRGMPLVYVESRLRGQLDEAESDEAAIEEEQLKLAQERLKLEMRQQELEQRKRDAREWKKSIVARLSG